MDTIKYDSFMKYKKDTFFKSINNVNSISSGVNLFEVYTLYKKLMQIEIENENGLSSYAEPRGQQLLISALNYYENFFYEENICGGNFYDLCLTNGATSGLNFVFDYFFIHGMKKGVLLGYSYTLFAMLKQRYGIDLDIIVSNEKNKVLPDIQQVCIYIKRNNPHFVCLTEPANPSGEMYDERSFRRLLKICKEKKCILLVDKCQRDEIQLINQTKYFSIHKVIKEENMIDNVVMINSFSKIRSIPGVRIGYITANRDIIEYLIYLNTITYWHCSALCSFAVTVDILYQIIYFDIRNKEKYIEDFREMLQPFFSNIAIVKSVFEYINPNTIVNKVNNYCEVIIQRYNIVMENYMLVKKYAFTNGFEITNLDGGYNFCIKINCKIDETLLKTLLSDKCQMEIFTQEDFCCNTRHSKKFWIRISCAERQESFKKKLLMFLDFLKDENLLN